MHQIPSIVFVSMLAMLIALCLAADSSSISMEIWYELSLLFLISVSVVVPCKLNTEELDRIFKQLVNSIYCTNTVVIIKIIFVQCNMLFLNTECFCSCQDFFLLYWWTQWEFCTVLPEGPNINTIWDWRWFTFKWLAEQNFC